MKKAILDDIILKGKEAKLNSFEQVCTLPAFKEAGIINEIAQKISSALFPQIVHIAFPRIIAHALIAALSRISAYLLGHSVKQALFWNKPEVKHFPLYALKLPNL